MSKNGITLCIRTDVFTTIINGIVRNLCTHFSPFSIAAISDTLRTSVVKILRGRSNVEKMVSKKSAVTIYLCDRNRGTYSGTIILMQAMRYFE